MSTILIGQKYPDRVQKNVHNFDWLKVPDRVQKNVYNSDWSNNNQTKPQNFIHFSTSPKPKTIIMDAFVASLMNVVNEKITSTIGAAQRFWTQTRGTIALARDAAKVIPLRTLLSLQLNVIKGKPHAFERLFDAMIFYEQLEEQEAERKEEEEAEEQQEEFDEFVRILAGMVEEAEDKMLKARELSDEALLMRAPLFDAADRYATPHAPTGVHGHACPTEDAPSLSTTQVADNSRAKRSLIERFNAAAASPATPESTTGKRDREEDTEEERPTRRQRTSEQFVVRQDIFENDDE